MTLLVTGCAGFIGSAVTRALLDQGADVIGVDEMNDAYDPRLKEHRLAEFDGNASFRFVRADVADRPRMHQLFQDHDIERVFHLAARAGVRQSVAQPWLYTHANLDGTLSLLEACRKHDVNKLLMASTSSLYGAHNDTPFREDADTSRPLSPYAASKGAAEAMCASYTHLHGIDTIIPRYFTVYGPAGRPDMSVFRFIRAISQGVPLTLYGTGEQSRDFTFVDDIAAGTLLASERLSGHEIINLGNDSPASVNELIEAISALVGKKPIINKQPMHAADMMRTWADITKARSLGWAPQTSLSKGLQAAVDWYGKHQELADSVDLGLGAASAATAPMRVSPRSA